MQAYQAIVEANRLKKEQEAEAQRLKKAAKSQSKSTASAGVSLNTDAEKVTLHFTMDGTSFLSDLRGPTCDVRVISDLSTRKGLKDAYHRLGFVTDSTLLWLTLPFHTAESTSAYMKDEQFWANLWKVFRYVHKDSGRIVFQMPRKSKTWQHRLVKEALEMG